MGNCEELTFSKLQDIADRHSNCLNDFMDIIFECPNKLMSIGIDLYGMFFPEKEVSKYKIYKGRLTKNEQKRNYEYYFNKEGKLRITKRYGEQNDLLNIIFYYYYEDLIEIVWYSIPRASVSDVGFIEYNKGELFRFVETISSKIARHKPIDSFREYLYQEDNDYMLKRTYALDLRDSEGNVWDKVSKYKKFK